ncbi:MAG: thiamine pyrophosphate-dependent enzyme [Candidatus Binatia bacterium]
MTSNALWTAAKYEIPLLVVVLNNHSYYNDEEHQERMARWQPSRRTQRHRHPHRRSGSRHSGHRARSARAGVRFHYRGR